MKALEELIKLIVRMLKTDPNQLAAVREVLGEMKWVLMAFSISGLLLILFVALAISWKVLSLG